DFRECIHALQTSTPQSASIALERGRTLKRSCRTTQRRCTIMSIASLEALFVHTLDDVYFAENLLAKKLPEMANKASASALQTAFEDHLAETKTHITRLDTVFKVLGRQPKAEECPGIEGIIEEAEELLEEISNGKTRDAALIASAQAAEHY